MSYTLAFLLSSLDSTDTLTDLGSRKAQLLANLLDASPGELAHSVFSTYTAQWKHLGNMWATFLRRRFYSNHMLSEVSLSRVISALTGPSNFLLLFSRSLATSSLPSTTIPPTTISTGRNPFYPSPLQADSPIFTVQSTVKEEVTYLSPKKYCLPFSRRL